MVDSYINIALDDLLSIYMQDLDQFFLIARLIAGLGLLVSVKFTFYKIMGGDDDSIKKFLTKFLAVFIGVIYYPTVLLLINYPLDLITNVARDMTSKDLDKIEEVRMLDKTRDATNLQFEVNKENEAEFKVLFEDNKDDDADFFSDMIAEATNSVVNSITDAITSIFIAIAEMALIILNIIRCFFLIVLSIFGVFVIALSAWPTLEGSFSQWLTKYINVYLWLAIGFILQSVLVKVQLISSVKNLTSPDDLSTSGYQLWNLLISLCTIIGYLAIPTLSSWMVNASTNTVGNKMGQSARQVVSNITSKGVSGGASASASAVV